MRTIQLFIFSFILYSSFTVISYSDIIADFNHDSLPEGFYESSWDGSVSSNQDGSTWSFQTKPDQWRYVSLISPQFSGDAFTVKMTCSNFNSPFDLWENVTLYLKGHNFETSLVFGLEDTLTFYLDSTYFAQDEGGQGTDMQLFDTMDDYPEQLILEIEFNGPGQPIRFFYTFGDGPRLLADQLTVIASAESQGDFDVTARFQSGETGPFGADVDSIEIIGGAPLPSSNNIKHELSKQVSTTQGHDNWYYRMGNPLEGQSLRDLVWLDTEYGNWVESYWYDETGDPDQTNWADLIDVDTVGGPWITLHNDTSPRLEWESPHPDGSSAIVTGTFKFESDWDTVFGIILFNGETVWESAPLTQNGAVEGFQVILPEVNHNDVLTFTADGSQWHWVQYVHTRIDVSLAGQTQVDNWFLY